MDTLISLNAPQPAEQRALVFLDAAIHDYSVTWYPFQASAGPDSPADVRWGEPRTASRPGLPEPIIEVLDIWREFLPENFVANLGRALEAWYRRTGELDSLREAARTERRALVVAPAGPRRPDDLPAEPVRDAARAVRPYRRPGDP
jgi:hypothetical protein